MRSASAVSLDFPLAKTRLTVEHSRKFAPENPRIHLRLWLSSIFFAAGHCFTLSGPHTAERSKFSVFRFDPGRSPTFSSDRVEGKVGARLLKSRTDTSSGKLPMLPLSLPPTPHSGSLASPGRAHALTLPLRDTGFDSATRVEAGSPLRSALDSMAGSFATQPSARARSARLKQRQK